MLTAWCLLRGLSTIFHFGKEFSTAAGAASKVKTQTAAEVGTLATTGAAKTRDSAPTAGRFATGKM